MLIVEIVSYGIFDTHSPLHQIKFFAAVDFAGQTGTLVGQVEFGQL